MELYQVASVNYDEETTLGIFDDWDAAVLYAKQYSLQLIIERVADHNFRPFWGTVDTAFGMVNQIVVTGYELNCPAPLEGEDLAYPKRSHETRTLVLLHGLDVKSDLYQEHFEPQGYPKGYHNR